MASSPPSESKGIYKCSEPGCDKEFSRSEHLSRHKLNHNPKVIYKCHYENCSKTFVRNDLLKRHLKRHELRSQKIKNNDFKNIRKLGGERTYKKNYDKFFMVGDDVDELKEKNIRITQINDNNKLATGTTINTYKRPKRSTRSKNNGGVSGTVMSSTPSTSDSESESILPIHPTVIPPPATPSNNLLDWIFNTETGASGVIDDITTDDQTSQLQQDFSPLPNQEPTPAVIPSQQQQQQQQQESESMFYNNANNFNIESLFFTGDNDGPDIKISPNSLLLNMFSDPTLFPANGMNNYTQYKSKLIKIDDLIYTDMMKLIPALSKNSDFTISNIEDLLESYWRFFHPFLPFLHKPSFTTVESPILLLLSMIMIGSRYVDGMYYNLKKSKIENKASKFKNASELGIMIAEPLRWLIFSSREFAPPSTLWVFQSLVMLEFYEKSCSSRVLHERSHLHHGTIIQLLRRSPSLGGNPIKLDNKNTAELTNHDIWKRWVNIESMKRITFAVFYLDVIDAIRYGHQIMVFAHQIQLPLPCDDDLWENMKVNNDENGTVVPKQPLFLDTLKAMLNDKKVDTTNFGKEILFAGLLSIMFQAQQREMQISYGLEKFDQAPNRNWKDVVSLALSIWKNDIAGSCCCALVSHSHNPTEVQLQSPRFMGAGGNDIQNSPNSTASIYSTDELDETNIIVPQFALADTTCKHTSYHIAHLYMRIPHYDFIIMAGAPFWMNVRPSNNDRLAIRNRMHYFFQSKDARICLIQCYLLLWETFLKPQDDPKDPNGKLIYSARGDVFNRSTMIGMCLIYLWDYNYIREGIENTALKFDPRKNLNDIREQEDGYSYLLRVRTEVCKLSKNQLLQIHHTKQSGLENHQIMLQYAKNVEHVKNKQLLVGLLKMVSPIFKESENELTREHGRLLNHCARRSCGDAVEICEDMYHVYYNKK